MVTREEEERRRQALLAQVMAQGGPPPTAQMSPNMMNQGAVTPEAMAMANQDFAPKQQELDRQRAYAREMMNSKGPGMKSAGNIVAAPTWSENLAGALRKGIGGYEMKKAREGQAQQDANMGLKAEAMGAVQADRYATERADANRGFQQTDTTIGQADTGLKQAAGRDVETMRSNRAGEAQAASSAADTSARGWAGEEGQEYLDLDDPTGKGTVTGYGSPTGPVMRGPDGTMMPLDESRYALRGKLVAAKAGDLERAGDPTAGEGVADVGNLMSYLDAPFLEEAVGMSANTLAGSVGLGNFGKGAQVQSTQRQIQQNVVNNLVPALTAAKLTPVSDKDLAKMESQFANAGTQPYGHVEFAVNNFRPLFDRKFDEAIRDGVQTPEAKAEYMLNLDKQIAKSAVLYGYPAEELRKAGVDPEIIEWAELNKAEFKKDMERRRNL